MRHISKGCTSDYSANKNPAQIAEGLSRKCNKELL